eukprot:15332256-Ditylum_brightwellii.AAC.1
MAKTSKMKIGEETAKDANEMEMADQDSGTLHLRSDDNPVDCHNNNETLLAKDQDASLIALRVFADVVNNVVLPPQIQSIRTTGIVDNITEGGSSANVHSTDL